MKTNGQHKLGSSLTEHEVETICTAVRTAHDHDSHVLCGLAGGGFIEELEESLRRYLGMPSVLALSSGTASLLTALVACGVRRGHDVILSPYDWSASVACVLHLGARPVFADIDPYIYTLDPASVAERITPHTRALIVTHIFGHPADMERLLDLARPRGIKVIEDCAQALGATYRGRKVGVLGDVGCFSFGWGKSVSGGEGGALVTHDGDLFERAVRFSQHPLRQMREGVKVNPFALNLRIHPLAALMARMQMEDLDTRLAARRADAEQLTHALINIPGIRPVFVAKDCTHAFHRYSPTYIKEELGGLPRAQFVAELAADGVPVHEGFIQTPLHHLLRSTFRHAPSVRRLHFCPVAEKRCATRELGLGLDDPPRWWDELLPLFKRIATGSSNRHTLANNA